MSRSRSHLEQARQALFDWTHRVQKMRWRSPSWAEVTYWALDVETGGLDPRRDPLLAVGMVPVKQGIIRLSESYESLVRPPRPQDIRAESIRAHQLTPAELDAAPPVKEVLGQVEARLRQGVLLVHHAAVDVGFLEQAFRQEKLRWPCPTVVDTVALLRRWDWQRRLIDPGVPAEPVLNLAKARAQLGLPAYPEHDARLDALAAAELFLVLRARLGARTLRDVC